MSLGLLGGSVTGAVAGFSIGLLIDCLLLQTLGAFALALLAVGYVAGRYRENVGRPIRGAVPLLGAGLTLLGVVAFAAIQVGTGVEADVSTLVIRDAFAEDPARGRPGDSRLLRRQTCAAAGADRGPPEQPAARRRRARPNPTRS